MKCVLMLVVCVVYVECQVTTIRRTIDSRPDLSQLKDYFKNFNILLYLNDLSANTDGKKLTFFAPNNEAFLKLPKELLDQLNRGSARGDAAKTFRQLMQYHTIEHYLEDSPLASSAFTEKSQDKYTAEGSKVFYLRRKNTYYVNGARIVAPDVAATNGLIHIVDSVLYPVGTTSPLYHYIEDSTQFSFGNRYGIFLGLLLAYAESPVQKGGLSATSCLRNLPATVFAPTDEALASVPQNQINQLKKNPLQLTKVVESHIICDLDGGVIHRNVFNDSLNENFFAMEGTIIPRRFGYDLFVSNDCVQGQLLDGSITASNGVLHPIDKLLGFKFRNIVEELQAQGSSLKLFYDHIRSSASVFEELNLQALPGTEVLESEKYTLFAPNEEAMDKLDFTQDNLENVLHLHMLKGEFTMSEMLNNVKKTTLGISPRTQQAADLIVVTKQNPQTGLTDTYVEVNHVRGKIIKGDICVNNGLIHIVDSVIGVPTKDAMQFFENPEFSTLYTTINTLSLNNLFSDPSRQITVFAPSNKAFENMRLSSVGRSFLQSDQEDVLSRIMERHVIFYTAFILTETTLPQNNIQTQFDMISLKKVGSQYYVTFDGNHDVLIEQPDVILTNGVLHIIDEVMFVDSLSAKEVVGGSSTVAISIFVMAIALSVLLIL